MLVCILIAYGSLYPFDFRDMAAGDWELLLNSWHGHTIRSDVLSNVVLFLPFGYFGVLAVGRRLWLAGLALLLGTGLQLLQLYLPSRDANLLDVAWNLAGAGAGAALAALPLTQIPFLARHYRRGQVFVLMLLGAWLCYRLLPFVPSLDWQEIKDSLKPLLLHPNVSGTDLLRNTVSWAVAAALWTALWHGRHTLQWLAAVACGLFLLEVIIVDNSVSLANVLGAALGLLLWHVLRPLPAAHGVLALLLLVSLLVSGLAPFELRATPAPFHWQPFYGFLGGSMLFNIIALFEKIFLYGSLQWLARRQGVRVEIVIGLALAVTAFIEAAQVHFSGHTPEITDPLLVLCLALALEKTETRAEAACR